MHVFRNLLGGLVAAALAGLAAPANAGIIYQQSTLQSPMDPLVNAGAFTDSSQELADDFMLSSGDVLDRITWKGAYLSSANMTGTESFTVHIHTDSSGLPATPQFYSFVGTASVVASGDSRAGLAIYDYSLDVTDVALAAGTPYWISIYTNEGTSNYVWSNSTDGSMDGAIDRHMGAGWEDFDDATLSRNNHIFALLNDAPEVPEPATLGLFLVGLAGLAGAARRRGAA